MTPPLVRALRRIALPAALGLPLLLARPAGASPVKIHQLGSQQAFAAGTLEGVRVDAKGVLSLAPEAERRAAIAEPFAFAAVALPHGWAIGTGGEGRVLRVTTDGEVSVLFDAPESNVFALWADPDGTLYAGTSPGGKVYRIPAADPAAAAPFFDPHETYIWAIERDRAGALWVATGSEGHLYRVDGNGKGELIYDGEDPHVRSLLAEPDGGMLLGTAGQGLIVRRSANGDLRTIYDSTLSEVVSMVRAPSGALFAAVLASESSLVDLAPAKSGGEAAAKDDGSGEASATVSVIGEGDGEAPAAGSRPAGARGPRSELVTISAEGFVEPVWSSQDETLFAMRWQGRRLYLATGGEGRLYTVIGADGEGGEAPPVPPLSVAIEHDFDERQAVAIAGGGSPTALPVVLTTNAASLFAMTTRAQATGTYTSSVLDSGLLARYGVFRWTGERPEGAAVELRFRTGSSAQPDATWSPWKGAGAAVSVTGGWETAVPAIGTGRFVQWQAILTGKEGRSPRLSLAELSYRQVNQRPRIERFGALDPGQILVPTNFNPADQVYEPASPNRDGIFTSLQAASAAGDGRSKTLWKRGQRTLRWRATDPNGDALRYRLELRKDESDSAWLPLAEELDSDSYGFDATVLPDGRYRFRLTASDREGNEPDSALAATQESESVVVDHTPPRRERVERDGAAVKVEVTDRWNPLREAVLSIDAGPWQPVAAADGLLDGLKESLLLPAIPRPAKMVLLRLTDAAWNSETFDLTSEVNR